MLLKRFFCIIICIIHGLLIFSQTKTSDVYEFPVKQGTMEWKQFETIEKRIAALQIPVAVLVKISTEGLLETCLEFPYLTNIFFAENLTTGYEALIAEFNGFRELFKRRDLPNVLLKKYKSFSENIGGIRLLMGTSKN